MRNYFYYIALVLLLPLFSLHELAAQQCGADEIHQRLLKNDAAYKTRMEVGEQRLQRAIQKGPTKRSSGNDTIPVVFHVLHTGESEGTGMNISDAQIISALDNLNNVFSGSLGATGTDIGIRFVFATRTPDGCSTTTGINRINATGVEDYENVGIGQDSARVNLFNLSRYNSLEYFNIWVVHEINDGTSTLGYATLPPADARYDGVVMLYSSTGYDPTGALGYNLSSTQLENESLVHEVGHYLGLYHTFQGDADRTTCPTDTDCTTDGDLCCDTDPHQRTYSNVCWTGVNNSCTGNNYGTVVQNYMAYSSEACRDRFTADQITRMTATMSTHRTSLLNGWPLQDPPSDASPVADCSPTTTDLDNLYGLGIEKVSINGYTFNSGGAIEDGGNIDRTCERIYLEAGMSYTIDVTMAGSNNEYVFIYLDFNNDGDFDTPSEGPFFSTLNTAHSISVSIPSSPLYNTPMLMRVISDNGANSGYQYGCQVLNYGQAEDYSFYIESPATLTVSETELSNIHTLGTVTSTAKTFTVSGDDLFGDATITSTGSDFELSTDGINYSNSLTLSESGGNLTGEPVTVYTRLKNSLSTGEYNDDISITSTDAITQTVSVSGRIDEVDGDRGYAFTISSGSISNYAEADEYLGITGSNPRTYEAWIKTSSGAGTVPPIIANGTNSTSQKWVIRLDNGRLRIEINGDYVVGDQLLDDESWHHIAVVLDGTTLDDVTLYTDGVANGVYSTGSSTATINTAASQELWIGRDHGSNYWEGVLDEIRVWSVARTEAEVRAFMHLVLVGDETGLEAYYQLNETSGTAIKDVVNMNDLTLQGAATTALSTVDVSTGTCSTVAVGGTGTAGVEVNISNLQIDFATSSTAPNGDMMIFRLEGAPANAPGIANNGTEHWVVRNFGTNTTGLDVESITMTLPVTDDVLDYHTSTMSFFKRASGSDGAWTTMATAATDVDYGAGAITFNGLSGFTSFSQLSVGSSGIILPVEMSYFNAQRTNAQSVALEWGTASEENNKGFEIMRSYDGENFETIGFVAGQGTVRTPTNYTEMIKEIRPVYYQLRQIDFNGGRTQTDIRFVAGEQELDAFTLYPNPSKGEVHLIRDVYQPEEILGLSLVNLQGTVLIQAEGSLLEVNDLLNQELDRVSNGVYLVQIRTANNQRHTKRLMINRND